MHVGLVYCAFMAGRLARTNAGNLIKVNNRTALRNTVGNLEFIANKDLADRQCKTRLACEDHTHADRKRERESQFTQSAAASPFTYMDYTRPAGAMIMFVREKK